MQVSQGFTAEVEEGGDVHSSGSFTCTETASRYSTSSQSVSRVLGGDGAAASPPIQPTSPLCCLAAPQGAAHCDFSVNF